MTAGNDPTVRDPTVPARRLGAQLLHRPAVGAVAVVRRILAVQAQDPRGWRLAVRSRSTGLTSADVEAALDARQLVVGWLNRGTLHLVAAEDYWELHRLTTRRLGSTIDRRLRQEGVEPEQAERGVEVLAEAVSDEGRWTRGELRERLDAAGVRTAGQALVHVLALASLRGHLVRGPMRNGEQAFVSAPAWLGPPPTAFDEEAALGRLARRYLAGHGPADAGDLAVWAGVPLGQARRGLATIADELTGPASGVVALATSEQPVDLPPPALLGAFDPILHGWASRAEIIGAHTDVVTTNGIFRPFALVDGAAVATWGLSDGRVRIRCLQPLDPGVRDALHAEAAAVFRYLGLPAQPPEFEPAP